MVGPFSSCLLRGFCGFHALIYPFTGFASEVRCAAEMAGSSPAMTGLRDFTLILRRSPKCRAACFPSGFGCLYPAAGASRGAASVAGLAAGTGFSVGPGAGAGLSSAPDVGVAPGFVGAGAGAAAVIVTVTSSKFVPSPTRTVTGPASVPGVNNPKPSTVQPRFGSLTSNVLRRRLPVLLDADPRFRGLRCGPARRRRRRGGDGGRIGAGVAEHRRPRVVINDLHLVGAGDRLDPILAPVLAVFERAPVRRRVDRCAGVLPAGEAQVSELLCRGQLLRQGCGGFRVGCVLHERPGVGQVVGPADLVRVDLRPLSPGSSRPRPRQDR